MKGKTHPQNSLIRYSTSIYLGTWNFWWKLKLREPETSPPSEEPQRALQVLSKTPLPWRLKTGCGFNLRPVETRLDSLRRFGCRLSNRSDWRLRPARLSSSEPHAVCRINVRITHSVQDQIRERGSKTRKSDGRKGILALTADSLLSPASSAFVLPRRLNLHCDGFQHGMWHSPAWAGAITTKDSYSRNT